MTRWWKARTRRVGGSEAVDQLAGVVLTPVVDDDELPGVAVLDGVQVGHHALQRGRDDGLLVAGGDDDRDEWNSSHCRCPTWWVINRADALPNS